PDFQIEPDGKRIHHRHAHAVQTAGDFVRILVELTARMQLGHDDFGGGTALAFMHIHRNTAAIIGHGAGTVGVERNRYDVAMTCDLFVYCVVDLCENLGWRAGPIVVFADIHAGPLATRL